MNLAFGEARPPRSAQRGAPRCQVVPVATAHCLRGTAARLEQNDAGSPHRLAHLPYYCFRACGSAGPCGGLGTPGSRVARNAWASVTRPRGGMPTQGARQIGGFARERPIQQAAQARTHRPTRRRAKPSPIVFGSRWTLAPRISRRRANLKTQQSCGQGRRGHKAHGLAHVRAAKGRRGQSANAFAAKQAAAGKYA